MAETTVFRLSGIGVPPYSARGLRQTLTPIAQAAQLRRTINGDLDDVAAAQFRKFQSTISGDDQAPPAVDGVWPGRTVTVDCIAELSVADDGEDPPGAPVLDRTPVPGSLRHEPGFWFYRPRLTMRVTAFSIDGDEWAAGVAWQLALEEV